MSAPKVGDVVRVEQEGKVKQEHGDGTLRVDFADNRQYAWVSPEHCTVIVPPIAVGDVVTAENIGQLGIGSVIGWGGHAAVRRPYAWMLSAPSSSRQETNESMLSYLADVRSAAVVLRIGGGS